MAVSRDGTAIAKVGYGTAEIQKISWGATELWSAVQPTVYPTVVDTASGSVHSAGTSSAISLPTLSQPGDVHLVFFHVATGFSGKPASTSAGWTRIRDYEGFTMTGAIFTANHGAGPPLITHPEGHRSWQVFTLRNVFSVYTVAPTLGNATTADAPVLAPSGGNKPYLWIVTAAGTANGVVTAAPTNFTDLVIHKCGVTATDSVTATARREFTGASLNPSAMPMAEFAAVAALTTAVAPNRPSGMVKNGSTEFSFAGNKVEEWLPDPSYPGSTTESSASFPNSELVTQSAGTGHRVQAKLVVIAANDTNPAECEFQLKQDVLESSADITLYDSGPVVISPGTTEVTLTADNVTLNPGDTIYVVSNQNTNTNLDVATAEGSWVRITKP